VSYGECGVAVTGPGHAGAEHEARQRAAAPSRRPEPAESGPAVPAVPAESRPERLRELQRTAGNQAVTGLLQRREVRQDREVTGPRDWTTADREGNTARWQAACLANLLAADSSQYVRVVERRDFYKWFYQYALARGFQTRWALAAYVVANGAHLIADMDADHAWANDGLHLADVELQGVMREGNQVIFDNVLPKLRDLLAGEPLRGRAAIEWDMRILAQEQALVQPMYLRMDEATVRQLLYIARKTRFAWVGAELSSEDEVPDGPGVRGGTVPAFPADGNIRDPGQRWAYGMRLGDQFTPGGTGFDPARDRMPAPGAGYTDGTELARVDTRAALHELDAWLNPDRLTRVRGTPGADLAGIVGRLSEREKQAVLADRSPDGWAYSTQLAQFPSIDEALVRRALPSAPAQAAAVAAFLGRYRAERSRVESENPTPMFVGP
jgi:hypothetical protein